MTENERKLAQFTEVEDFLILSGFRKSQFPASLYNPNTTVYYNIPVHGYPVCKCNERLLLDVWLWKLTDPRDQFVHTSAEIGIRAENDIGAWVDLKFYGISLDTLMKDFLILKARILEAWEVCNSEPEGKK